MLFQVSIVASGFNVEYSSMVFALLFLLEYCHNFNICFRGNFIFGDLSRVSI